MHRTKSKKVSSPDMQGQGYRVSRTIEPLHIAIFSSFASLSVGRNFLLNVESEESERRESGSRGDEKSRGTESMEKKGEEELDAEQE